MPDFPEGFVQINKDSGPPQNNNPPPPRIPPQQLPMRQPGDRDFAAPPPPMGMPPGMPPANHGMPPQGPPFVPPPPAHSVPHDLRPRQKIEVHDTRSERLSEADIREQLSNYVVIRLEKVVSPHDVDEEGYRTMPTWQKATRTEQTDMTKEQANRRVRDLERYTIPVADKKSQMSPAIQRQIEAAQQRLESTEADPRYYYVLSQFEWQDRKMDAVSTEYVTRNKKSKRIYTLESRRSRPKRKMERVSVTAYFRRTPRPDENAWAMLPDLDRNTQMRMLPAPQMNAPMPPMPPPAMQPPMPQPLPPAPMAPPNGNGGGGNMGPNKAVNLGPGKQNPGPGPGPGPGKQGKNNAAAKIIKMDCGSPRSSRTSMSSDDSFSGPESVMFTPESSVGSSRSRYSRYGKHRERSRGRSRHRDRPENFGLEVPRRHSKHDHDFSIQHLPRRQTAPLVRRPSPLPLEMRGALESPSYDDFDNRAFARPRGRALPPAIIDARPGVRRLPEHEARREIYADDLDRVGDRLERLRLEDDLYREREYRLEQDALLQQQEADLFRGRRMQDRMRRDPLDDKPWSPMLDRGWPEQHARQYMRNRERADELDLDNPFAPAGGRMPYYAEGRRL